MDINEKTLIGMILTRSHAPL